jgi:hypothetical protein
MHKFEAEGDASATLKKKRWLLDSPTRSSATSDLPAATTSYLFRFDLFGRRSQPKDAAVIALATRSVVTHVVKTSTQLDKFFLSTDESGERRISSKFFPKVPAFPVIFLPRTVADNSNCRASLFPIVRFIKPRLISIAKIREVCVRSKRVLSSRAVNVMPGSDSTNRRIRSSRAVRSQQAM